MKKILTIVAVAFAMAMSACGSKEIHTTDGVEVLADDAMFRPNQAVDVPTVLDFNAVWCVPCKKLVPAYDKVAEEYKGKVNFYSVDFEKLPETAQAWEITSVPTVIFVNTDGSFSRHEGLVDFEVGMPDSIANQDEYNQVLYQNVLKMVEQMQ